MKANTAPRSLDLRLLAAVVATALTPAPAISQEPVWTTDVTPSYSAGGRAVVPLHDGGALFTILLPSVGTDPEVVVVDGAGGVVTQVPLGGSTWSGRTAGAPDGSGGAFVVGSASGGGLAGPSLGGQDGTVFRFDGLGQLVWAVRIGGTGQDLANDIVADGSGGLYVVGRTSSAGFGTPSPGPTDAFIARMDGGGNVLWVRRAGQASRLGQFFAVAIDGQGAILCGGELLDTSSFPFFPSSVVAGYDASGNLLFRHDSPNSSTSVVALAPSPAGYMQLAVGFAGGSSCTARDLNGGVLFSVPFANGASAEAFDLVRLENGTYVLGGHLQPAFPGIDRRQFRAFDAAGSVLWDLGVPHPLDRPSQTASMASDGFGSLYAAGFLSPGGGHGVTSAWVGRIAIDDLGVAGCSGQPNSTALPARSRALGSPVRSDNRITAFTADLPPAAFGYYLLSTTTGFTPGPGGSQGDLCLAGSIGRMNRPGEILAAGVEGRFHLVLDLDDIAQPNGSVSVQPGETWHLQSWYRDQNPGATSNFSSSVAFTTQ